MKVWHIKTPTAQSEHCSCLKRGWLLVSTNTTGMLTRGCHRYLRQMSNSFLIHLFIPGIHTWPISSRKFFPYRGHTLYFLRNRGIFETLIVLLHLPGHKHVNIWNILACYKQTCMQTCNAISLNQIINDFWLNFWEFSLSVTSWIMAYLS